MKCTICPNPSFISEFIEFSSSEGKADASTFKQGSVPVIKGTVTELMSSCEQSAETGVD